jgi:hypothetical protein
MQRYRGHLALTIRWLLSEMPKIGDKEKIHFEIPAGISKRDFYSDISFLDNLITRKSNKRLSLTLFIDCKNQNFIFFSEYSRHDIEKILKEVLDRAEMENGSFVYKEEIGGYVNSKDESQRVTFKPGTARLIIHELNKRLNKITSNKEIAETITEQTGKIYTADKIRSSLDTTVKPKIKAAQAEIGFPYEIRHPEIKRKGQYDRSINTGKNSGYGLFRQ